MMTPRLSTMTIEMDAEPLMSKPMAAWVLIGVGDTVSAVTVRSVCVGGDVTIAVGTGDGVGPGVASGCGVGLGVGVTVPVGSGIGAGDGVVTETSPINTVSRYSRRPGTSAGGGTDWFR